MSDRRVSGRAHERSFGNLKSKKSRGSFPGCLGIVYKYCPLHHNMVAFSSRAGILGECSIIHSKPVL